MWRALAGGTAVFSLLAMSCDGPVEPNVEEEPGSTVVEILLSPHSASNLTGEVALAVSPAPSVLAVDQDGKPAGGVVVLFQPEGGGTVSRGHTTTDSRGVATVEWYLGPAAGTQTVSARAQGYEQRVTFTASVRHGSLAGIDVGGQHQFGRTGSTLRDPLRVYLKDRFGNPVPGVSVRFRVTAGGGALVNPLAETDSSGVASAGVWRLGPEEGIQEVLAEAGNLHVTFTARVCDCLISTLAYVRDGDVFVRNMHGEESRLTTSADHDAAPAWTPDGSRIAFARVRGCPDGFGKIYTMDADGLNQALFLSRGDGADCRLGGLGNPAWSPDGRQLAVTMGDCIYDCEIMLADLAGNLSAPIATWAAFPAWSPDGSRIAYVGLSGDDGYHTLQVMKADGSGKTELVPSDGSGIHHPTWSPDGRQIAFARCSQGSCQVWLIAADGSGLRRITDFQGPQAAFGPAWSPDGYWIAITIWDLVSSRPRVALVLSNGGGYDVLWEGHSPAWRPDVPQP